MAFVLVIDEEVQVPREVKQPSNLRIARGAVSRRTLLLGHNVFRHDRRPSHVGAATKRNCRRVCRGRLGIASQDSNTGRRGSLMYFTTSVFGDCNAR